MTEPNNRGAKHDSGIDDTEILSLRQESLRQGSIKVRIIKVRVIKLRYKGSTEGKKNRPRFLV